MNFYSDTGVLVMGSWLRRISEKFLNEISAIYKELDIPFESSWFPVFYLLKGDSSVSIIEMAKTLDISHSAVSQMVSNLKKKGLVRVVANKSDGRRKNVALTDAGKAMLEMVLPIWNSLEQVMSGLWDNPKGASIFIKQLSELEFKLNQSELSRKVLDILPDQEFTIVRVHPDKHRKAWKAFLSENERYTSLSSSKSIICILLVKEKIYGFVSLSKAENHQEIILEQVFIQADYRRKGWAIALLKRGLKETGFVKEDHCLVVKSGDLPVLNLLLKAGITFKMFAK